MQQNILQQIIVKIILKCYLISQPIVSLLSEGHKWYDPNF